MRLMKAINKQEQGQVLILLVLIIFACSSIVMVPLLNFMTTGVVTTKNEGLHTQEIYAAEAGVRDAIWKIQRVVPGLPKQETDISLQYAISGNVNGKSVNVTISWIDSATYRVHSLATNPDTGHRSTIDSNIAIDSTGGVDLAAFTSNAMTTSGNLTTKSSDTINGNIWIGGTFDNKAHVSGNETLAPVTGWPTEAQMKTYYSTQVDVSSPWTSSTINIAQSSQSGPLYAHGASSYTVTGNGQMNGVLYIDGNLDISSTATINLNGNPIFVTGTVGTSPSTSIIGPGAIIAIGSINFQPGASTNYIFVMSVSGTVNFQPNCNFVGAVAGDLNINLQPGCTFTWKSPGVGNLDAPGLFNTVSTIKTWAIN